MVNMQVSSESEFFANLVVDAVSVLDPQTLDLKMIGMKKVKLASQSGHLHMLSRATEPDCLLRTAALSPCISDV